MAVTWPCPSGRLPAGGDADGVGPNGEMALGQGDNVMSAHECRDENRVLGAVKDFARWASLFDEDRSSRGTIVRQRKRLVPAVGTPLDEN